MVKKKMGWVSFKLKFRQLQPDWASNILLLSADAGIEAVTKKGPSKYAKQ